MSSLTTRPTLGYGQWNIIVVIDLNAMINCGVQKTI